MIPTFIEAVPLGFEKQILPKRKSTIKQLHQIYKLQLSFHCLTTKIFLVNPCYKEHCYKKVLLIILHLISALCFFVLLSSYNNVPVMKSTLFMLIKSTFWSLASHFCFVFLCFAVLLSQCSCYEVDPFYAYKEYILKSGISFLLCVSLFCCPLITMFML